jgi:hypothetical protein
MGGWVKWIRRGDWAGKNVASCEREKSSVTRWRRLKQGRDPARKSKEEQEWDRLRQGRPAGTGAERRKKIRNYF